MERRSTVQKSLVLNAVQNMRRHVTADEVYHFIAAEHPSVGKGTVYRNLHILSEEGKIRHVGISDGSDVFDFTLKEHYHIECTDCHRISDVDMDAISNMIDLIHNKHGFEFHSYDILFKGVCPTCQQKKHVTE